MLAVVLGLFSTAASGEQPTLKVAEGVLVRDGVPYRGVGVNYFSAFVRTLRTEEDESYQDGFKELAARNVPFARFAACGFWPNDWTLYQEDRARYFALLDGVVDAACAAGVGLIPSLFWHQATIGDLVGESRSRWGDPESRTHAFMRTYTTEVVTRYCDRPCIWAWEFGNEFNLQRDLPNAADHRPKIVTRLGTPDERSAADDLAFDDVRTAHAAFAALVRELDPDRPITTGCSMPRATAANQRRSLAWVPDTEAEQKRHVIDATPADIDLISVHVYPHHRERRFGRDDVTYEAALAPIVEAARSTQRAVFVGEFGVGHSFGDAAAQRAELDRQLAAIDAAGIPLAALWVFDLPHQDGTWNVAAENVRAWMLDRVGAANRR